MENQNLSYGRVRACEPEQQQSVRMSETKSDLTPRFRLIFCTVAALTALTLILNVLLAAFGGDSEQVRAAAEACSTTYMMGFGAIVGLIGGKVV